MNQSQVKSLIKLLDDPDTEVFHHVEDELLDMGESVIEDLESAWEQSMDAVLQERIENLIHKIQFRNVKNELGLWNLGGSYDLLQGIITLNKYQYPDLDEQKIINQIEAIKRDIWQQMMYDMSAVEKVKLINHIFYGEYRFSGNTINHKDPKNSYISQVLETKKGNQIMLASIYSIIAQKLDVPIYGVNLPQHFVLAYVEENEKQYLEGNILFYINAFNKGFMFSRREVDSFLKQLQIAPDKQFYEPCSNIEIIKRMLRNLISSYENLAAIDKVAELKELLRIFE